ncbi:MAG: excinuclease ABC subunit UvrA [Candidatus Marinimicrobia bacterium]|nr:excinuclease ABC subunit UvrA [Candidatus Neomarinimicrobiota bacterium]
MSSFIEIRDAHTHNLKHVDLDIPREKLVVFSGVSGSGKSSLVFDTLYVEAQRQLIETFSTFARRRLPKLTRPNVESIRNLGTGIIIDQKRLGRTLRSTVGTATEIYTYLRLLFSRVAQPFVGFSHVYSFNHPDGMCLACKGLGRRIRIDENLMMDPELSLREGGILHPDYKMGGYYWRTFISMGWFNPDKKLKDFSDEERYRLFYEEHGEYEIEHGGINVSRKWTGLIRRLESHYINKAEDEAPETRKDAYQRFLVHTDCDVCGGRRLNDKVLTARLEGYNIADLAEMELTDLDSFLATLGGDIATPLVEKMRSVLGHLIDIGVGYLTLSRAVATLSGGESQRVKMARQLDCDLTGLMYVLDEPSIGLHPRDTEKLLHLLFQLRDQGNSVLVVEHDPAVIKAADWVVDVGPAAGTGGGEICFQGTVPQLQVAETSTGRLISGKRMNIRGRERKIDSWFKIENASSNNLRSINVNIPQKVLCCVTGVAGSGKSTLVHEEILKQYPAVVVDQSPVGKSNRSNPMTYTGIFDYVRTAFAVANAVKPSLFSFNSTGACPQCKGQGRVKVEMNFLDDISVECSECKGKRYRPEVLEYRLQGLSIHDVLQLTVEQALTFFRQQTIRDKLHLLKRVGLNYLQLGQPLSTVSGGEAQRLKLADELGKQGNLYILDEPTTGLHMADIERLMEIVHELVDSGNSVIIIEHNLDVIAQADWIIDLGPEGGKGGGRIMATGRPLELASHTESITGAYLKSLLN